MNEKKIKIKKQFYKNGNENIIIWKRLGRLSKMVMCNDPQYLQFANIDVNIWGEMWQWECQFGM